MNMKTKKKTIKSSLVYTPRAFRQDAHEAMNGDILKALVEFITNADDAYDRIAPDCLGRIEIHLGPSREDVGYDLTVRDFATGMSEQEMRSRILEIGRRTSGFESGKLVRGALGRGLKDPAAFGNVIVESIKEGQYCKTLIQTSGEALLHPAVPACNEVRSKTGIHEGNGTVINLEVESIFRRPQFKTLVQNLRNHYQLRQIFASPARQVFISDHRHKAVQLTYERPTAPLIYDEEIEIPSYAGAKARIKIYQSKIQHHNSPRDTGRPEGLLICGNKAIYDNTLGSFEGNPYAGAFSGTVECPHIDILARTYDDLADRGKRDPMNPLPIISRRRDGLQDDHPFTRSLTKIIDGVLGNLIREAEAEAKAGTFHQTDEMKRSLDTLAKGLTKLLNDDLEDTENETTTKPLKPIAIVPGGALLLANEEQTLNVYVRDDIAQEGENLTLVYEPGVDLPDGTDIPLLPHPKNSDLLVGKIRVIGKAANSKSRVTATVNGYSCAALIEVLEHPRITEPLTTLEFTSETYTMKESSSKRIQLLAPDEVVQTHGCDIELAVVTEGISIANPPTQLRRETSTSNWVADIKLQSNAGQALATVTARLGTLETKCKVKVLEQQGGFTLKIEPIDQYADPYNRVILSIAPDQMILKIMCKHPENKRYFGDAPDFPGQNLRETKVYLAELIAHEVAQFSFEKRFGTQELDAPMIFADFKKLRTKYTRACHEILVPKLNTVESKPAAD
jgi:hypothetical protein